MYPHSNVCVCVFAYACVCVCVCVLKRLLIYDTFMRPKGNKTKIGFRKKGKTSPTVKPIVAFWAIAS